MTLEEHYKIISNDYADLFIEYNRNPKLLEIFPNSTPHLINTRFAIAYVPSNQLNSTFISQFSYSAIPNLYGLTSQESLEASGVRKLRRIPGFNLLGKDVLVGIIDTGIDYKNPIFLHPDGSSKIQYLWDQALDSNNVPERFFYGTEFTKNQIDQALTNNDPLSLVPSTDENGHGTMLAGIMAGSEDVKNNFYGVAPEADLIVVKLKQAKQNLKDFYIIPPDNPCYQENDIMWGIEYILQRAEELKRPCAVCIGLGSSQGGHDGRGALSNLLSIYSGVPGFIICLPAGNEGDKKRHYSNFITPSDAPKAFELNIGEQELGFSMEFWGNPPNIYSIDISSPTGEFIPSITKSLKSHQLVSFLFEKTLIDVDYQLIESRTSAELILLRFHNPTPGIWRFHIYSKGNTMGAYNIWLPMNGFISKDTYFLQPDPYTTITSPGDGTAPITVTAYNPDNDSLFLGASKGYTRDGIIKPELAAPGVNIVTPTLGNGFIYSSGTGIAAAHVAGISAIMLEWGIIRGFYPDMDTEVIKKYLIRGAKRSNTQQYPNKDLGYGIVDIYNVFNVLRTDFPSVPNQY
ncbi:S8 family peptidase [Anaerocolumna chitinilytica]|uniref:Peptidase S8/S53 domain-containing protein n=1 Tax=Anaerocolumna chitinilytica TaxID=1727145 RepID=A0A7I8DMK5_9FIRM|nr:S8 family peptidase [Anaerocolumna chitinilytica]BCJ98554.1 hypothetical protein bsdcttw_15950 [Anaerocolumna chitinilytica]